MNALDALLADIRLTPDDDTSRLVLADWLDENGTAAQRGLGEFIRIQCQLARLPRQAPGRADLEWRQRSLWWQHVEDWLGRLYEVSSAFDFHRGLAHLELHGEQLDQTDLRAVGADGAWRWVDHLLLLRPTAAQFATLLESSALRWLGSLEVRQGRGLLRDEGDLDAPLLRELRLHDCRLTSHSLALLASSAGLDQLVVLSVQQNQIGGSGLEPLLDGSLTALRELDLRHNVLGTSWPAALTELFRSPLAVRLTRLGLGYNGVQLEHLAALAAVPALPALRELDLAGNALDDLACQTLARWPGLRSLRALDLSDNQISAVGVAALAATAALDELEALDLRDNDLDNDALRALTQAPRLYSLRRLRLSMQVRRVCHPAVLQHLRGRFGYALDWD